MSKKSSAEKQGYDVSLQDRNLRGAAVGQQDAELGKESAGLDYYTGSKPEDTGLYKALLSSRIEGTNRAYENAKASATARSKMAGFGYTSPIGNAGEYELNAQEAGDLARAPGEALKETVPYNMQALDMRGGIARQHGQTAGMYSDEGSRYFGTGADAEKARLAKKGGLFKKIAGAGLVAGGVMTGNPYLIGAGGTTLGGS